MYKVKESESVVQNLKGLFLLITVRKCKRQWSRSKGQKISRDKIFNNTNLSD